MYRKKSLFTRCGCYIKERFPVLPLFLYALFTLIGINNQLLPYNLQTIIILSVLFVLFLFHLRVLDEFKDHVYDTSNFPHRPVQKGLVSLKELKILGIINFLAMLILGLIVSPFTINISFYISLLYTGLMFKEFFARTFLKQNIIIYLVSHEIVFVPLFIFFFSSYFESIWIPLSADRIASLLYFILPIILIEIGRKIQHRYNAEGLATDDTYAYHWGERRTIQIFSSLVICCGLLSLFMQTINNLLSLLLLLSAVLLFALSKTKTKYIVKHSMLITTFYALVLPLLPLV